MIELGEYEITAVDLHKDRVKLGKAGSILSSVKIDFRTDIEDRLLVELGANIGKKFKLVLQPVGYLTIDARDVVKSSDPVEEGARLARHILSSSHNFSGLKIDISMLPGDMVISPFFNTFLQTIYEQARTLLGPAREVIWIALHNFQSDNIKCWVRDFKPFEGK